LLASGGTSRGLALVAMLCLEVERAVLISAYPEK